MLEIILDAHILFVLMGVMTVLGVVSKLVANVTLKRMVHAAGNMNKSTHPLMRLVRAKFEHACMISDTVENVEVFVYKYLYEYRVAGMKLHSWRRMEKAASGMCLLLGAAGAALEYAVNGMQDMVLKTGAAGAGLAILIYLVHLTTDENYRLEAAKNYMVDYLENVCRHRYEKAYQKELKVMAPESKTSDTVSVPAMEFGAVPDAEPIKEMPVKEMPVKEMPLPDTEPEIAPSVVPKQQEVPEVKEPKKPEPPAKDVLIRQILEEFMA